MGVLFYHSQWYFHGKIYIILHLKLKYILHSKYCLTAFGLENRHVDLFQPYIYIFFFSHKVLAVFFSAFTQ